MAFANLRKKINKTLQKPGSLSLDKYEKLLQPILEYSETLDEISDADMLELAKSLQEKLQNVNKFSNENLLEIVALAQQAGKRALNQVAFESQILGTLALLDGHIIEMGTGEGKTLTGVMAAVGFALNSQNTHIITTNDYLAQRDAKWMQPLYNLLGISVAWISEHSTSEERLQAYRANVMYASVNEIGFDLLRDRLVTSLTDRVRGDTQVVIIDEVDSILIDEAKIPLVLAGSSNSRSETNEIIKNTIANLVKEEHFVVNYDSKTTAFTDAGITNLETALGNINLYENANLLAQANVTLYAQELVQRDIDYLVENGEVKLIDSSRGRVAQLQRWPDGLQAAVEVKENLQTTDSGYILDTTTIQALIRVYPKIAGMTGTALTVAEQFKEFYDLEVVVIPSHKENIRLDEPDLLYETKANKEQALLERIIFEHEKQRPLLIGTVSVAETESLAKLLQDKNVDCIVLNAKNEFAEAKIVANAGALGSIIVSTQMAGRGVDILLGGEDGSKREEVLETGGLLVIGTSRYEVARLNNQLRGRAGRQGDPGGSVFFTSLEDDLLIKHASVDDLAGMQIGVGGRIDSKKANYIVEHAQKVAEGVHRDLHRNTWRYNRLVEHQRNLVVEYREKILATDWAVLQVKQFSKARYEKLLESLDVACLDKAIVLIYLAVLDKEWSNYLDYLADLREGIHLRGLGKGINPLDEFHKDAIKTFAGFLVQVSDLALQTYEEVSITESGPVLEDVGFARPSSTWTYLVTDDPFGSDIDSIVSGLRRFFARKKDSEVEV